MKCKPDTYREQPGCQNCGHVFRLYEHDGGNQYFCHADKSKRPRCGSVAMHEMYPERMLRVSDKEYDEMSNDEKDRMRHLDTRSWGRYDDKWLAWSEPREVIERGVCDEWVPQKGKR